MADWSYPGLESDKNPCDGCHGCALRCTAGIQMTQAEFEDILEHLRGLDPRQVIRVLEQEKRVPWFEDIETEYCTFYDVTRRRCLVYPARPLICRLFGRVEWLPCPLSKSVPQIADGIALMRAYAGKSRAVFSEWCTQLGIFDVRQLTSAGR